MFENVLFEFIRFVDGTPIFFGVDRNVWESQQMEPDQCYSREYLEDYIPIYRNICIAQSIAVVLFFPHNGMCLVIQEGLVEPTTQPTPPNAQPNTSMGPQEFQRQRADYDALEREFFNLIADPDSQPPLPAPFQKVWAELNWNFNWHNFSNLFFNFAIWYLHMLYGRKVE